MCELNRKEIKGLIVVNCVCQGKDVVMVCVVSGEGTVRVCTYTHPHTSMYFITHPLHVELRLAEQLLVGGVGLGLVDVVLVRLSPFDVCGGEDEIGMKGGSVPG